MADFFKEQAEADTVTVASARTVKSGARPHCPGYSRRISALDRLDKEMNTMTDVKGEGQMRKLARLYRLRDGMRTAFESVEANDAHGIAVLAAQKVSDHSFEVGCLGIGFPPTAAQVAEIIDH